MHKHPSCSFHSDSSDINTTQQNAKEQSIINEYRKMQESSQIHQYSQENIPYSELPKFVNQELKKSYSQCMYLDRFTFYEMFTMLIVQYLFKVPTQAKNKKINHLKSLVCSPNFLEGSIFTKGLIITGLRNIQQLARSRDIIHPLGQCLLNCDSICAFTECWKQLVLKICKQNNMPIMPESEIDSSIFQLFASYFHVKFDVYWKQKGNKLWKEHFTYQNASQNADTLAVIVNPEYQISVSQRAIKISQSRASGSSSLSMTKSNSWNYLILTNPAPLISFKKNLAQENQVSEKTQKQNAKDQLPNGEEISRISEIDYSCGQTEEIKILLQQKIPQRGQTIKKMTRNRVEHPPAQQCLSTILNTMSKANNLIEDMKKYLGYLQSIQLPNIQIQKQIFAAI